MVIVQQGGKKKLGFSSQMATKRLNCTSPQRGKLLLGKMFFCHKKCRATISGSLTFFFCTVHIRVLHHHFFFPPL